MQRFMQAAGIADMVHVPFSGSAPALQSLVTGGVQAMFSSPSTTIQMASPEKVRIIGVAGPARDPNVPDIPTIAESGLPGFQSNTWFALMASAKVPADVLEKIRLDAIRATAAPEPRRAQTHSRRRLEPGRKQRGGIPPGHQGRSWKSTARSSQR